MGKVPTSGSARLAITAAGDALHASVAELVVAEALLIALGHHEEELVIAHPELGAILEVNLLNAILSYVSTIGAAQIFQPGTRSVDGNERMLTRELTIMGVFKQRYQIRYSDHG